MCAVHVFAVSKLVSRLSFYGFLKTFKSCLIFVLFYLLHYIKTFVFITLFVLTLLMEYIVGNINSLVVDSHIIMLTTYFFQYIVKMK